MILTGATVLGSDRLPSDQRTATLEAIKRNARAQARLVDDLLDVSRGMAGTLRLEVEPVSVGDLVQGAVETVGVAADAKGVRLTVAIEPAVGTIAGDGARLQQVVWNLLSNAVKFTAAGGEVMVRAAREASSVLVIVEDTGIGISPEFLPHVFDRFRQEHTGATRRYGGLGLGLAIARHLVELHGGGSPCTAKVTAMVRDSPCGCRPRAPTQALAAEEHGEQRQDDADDDRGGEREVETKILPLDHDVPGQPAEPGQASAKGQERPQHEQHATEDHQRPAEISHRQISKHEGHEGTKDTKDTKR